MWLSSLGLFQADKTILKDHTAWLNDSIVYAAQQLLKQTGVEGLRSPQCGKTLNFKPIWSPHGKFAQVLHVEGNHWVAVSNLKANRGQCNVYDSLLPKKVGFHTKQQVCSFVRPASKVYTFNIMNIMAQPNVFDCGLFAIANITELVLGFHPGKCVWDVGRMRSHLITCLENKQMERFPTVRERRLPLGMAVRASVTEEIHCICRMPYDNRSAMIECCSCHVWYHGQCVDVQNIDDYSRVKWWCRECQDTFEPDTKLIIRS